MIAHYNYMNQEEKARVRVLARTTWRTMRQFKDAKLNFCDAMAYTTLDTKQYERYRDFMKTKYGYKNYEACRRDIEKVEGIWQTWLKTIEVV